MENGVVTLNAQNAKVSIARIFELIENLGSATRTFSAHLQGEYEKSNLAWMKELVNEAGKLESVGTTNLRALEDLQVGLNKYVNELTEYSEDKTGL